MNNGLFLSKDEQLRNNKLSLGALNLIPNRNTPPEFTNVPKFDVTGVEENNVAGDLVYHLNQCDPNTVESVKYFCTFPDGCIF